MSKRRLSIYYRLFIVAILALIVAFSSDFSTATTDSMDWVSFSIILPLETWICLILLIISYPVYRFWKKRLR
ncbi:hypothetical protein SAMN04490243_2512 [Robiginitalea myxolifaciens]|uniref:Uncharacterized protein n=1 Tax=Robiginitalea myxolifaciens TaxID=400055 RepID=A0A1I6HBU2_9FLAO|nr:hypothetical protein SAMN04490243_2512 [Robiginitalea myxolifaciens]